MWFRGYWQAEMQKVTLRHLVSSKNMGAPNRQEFSPRCEEKVTLRLICGLFKKVWKNTRMVIWLNKVHQNLVKEQKWQHHGITKTP